MRNKNYFLYRLFYENVVCVCVCSIVRNILICYVSLYCAKRNKYGAIIFLSTFTLRPLNLMKYLFYIQLLIV